VSSLNPGGPHTALVIESLESLDDNKAEEISEEITVLKDKEDELLEELLDDTSYYSAEENENYFEEEADTESVGDEANTYQYQDIYANDLSVNPHDNITPSVEARNFDREQTI
jgi:hypothetical protein